MANARLGWFSPLGVAASIRASARRVGLRAHCFRFSACAASEWPLGELVLPPSVSEIAAGRVGSSAFCFGDCPWRVDYSAGRVGLRAHCFRFSACTDSEWPLGEFVLPPSASGLPFGGLSFGLTASAFRHAPLRSGCWASWFFRLPLRKLPSASWPSGSLLPLFGMRRSAPPRRRSEDRRSTTTRHLFHFKTLIPTC